MHKWQKSYEVSVNSGQLQIVPSRISGSTSAAGARASEGGAANHASVPAALNICRVGPSGSAVALSGTNSGLTASGLVWTLQDYRVQPARGPTEPNKIK